MTKDEKLEVIADVLEMELEEIDENQELSAIETWDSVAVLSMIAVINERFDRFPLAEELLRLNTVRDLMDVLE